MQWKYAGHDWVIGVCFSMDGDWNDWIFLVHTHPAGSHCGLCPCLEREVGQQIWWDAVQSLASWYVFSCLLNCFRLFCCPEMSILISSYQHRHFWAEKFCQFLLIFRPTLWTVMRGNCDWELNVVYRLLFRINAVFLLTLRYFLIYSPFCFYFQSAC